MVCICGEVNCVIPYGLCHCGCGCNAPIAERTNLRNKAIAGKPQRYIRGHVPRKARTANHFGIYDGENVLFISLPHGREAIVSACKSHLIDGVWCQNTDGSVVQFRNDSTGKRKRVWLHRVIMGDPFCSIPLDIDHEKGNKLDNRDSKIRWASHAENGMNQRNQDGRSSKFKGVSYTKRTGRWESSIKKDGKKMHLGHFDDEEEAARKYDSAAKNIFGQFARCNFP